MLFCQVHCHLKNTKIKTLSATGHKKWDLSWAWVSRFLIGYPKFRIDRWPFLMTSNKFKDYGICPEKIQTF
jgi:hypothetical protein